MRKKLAVKFSHEIEYGLKFILWIQNMFFLNSMQFNSINFIVENYIHICYKNNIISGPYIGYRIISNITTILVHVSCKVFVCITCYMFCLKGPSARFECSCRMGLDRRRPDDRFVFPTGGTLTHLWSYQDQDGQHDPFKPYRMCTSHWWMCGYVSSFYKLEEGKWVSV